MRRSPPTVADRAALSSRNSGPVNLTECATNIPFWTPSCLLALYNMDNYTAQATSNNSLGVVSYFGDCQSKTDLQNFFAEYRPEAVGEDFELLNINNATYGTVCEGEGTLDVEVRSVSKEKI